MRTGMIMGGNNKVWSIGLFAALLLAVNTTGATALVIPGRNESEPKELDREVPSYYQEGGFIYSSPPEQTPGGREIRRMSHPSKGKRANRRGSSLERARQGYPNEKPVSELQANRTDRGTINYRNPTRPPKYRRGSTGLRIPGRRESTKRQSRTTNVVASWYGWDFHGRQTANGETYNMYKHTAAHKTLPFGTVVRVTNLRNGRQAVVRINDRGPFIEGRDIDLSYATARELGMLDSGLEEVRLEILRG
jgi:rare lipoprotein A (peptidoglycan hydrolase)